MMKMWNDEKRSGTIELLLTSGTSNFSLLLGKFLSCSFILSIAILATIIIPLLLSFIVIGLVCGFCRLPS